MLNLIVGAGFAGATCARTRRPTSISIGRLARYRYCNMDPVAAAALAPCGRLAVLPEAVARAA